MGKKMGCYTPYETNQGMTGISISVASPGLLMHVSTKKFVSSNSTFKDDPVRIISY